MPRSPLVFVLPPGSDEPSGGNIYNRNLLRALADLVPVTTTTFLEAEALFLAETPGTYLFDTLELDRVGTLPKGAPGQHLGLLVHHLPSLEPDLPVEHPSLAMERAMLPRFDVLVATSAFTRAWLTDRGVLEERVLTVPPATSRDQDHPRTYSEPLAVLAVANLIPRKDVLSLLRALARLGPAPYVLRLKGRTDLDASYADACRRVVTGSSWLSRHVLLEGPVPHEEMSLVYRASHLFVSAARMETFGMALQEARAHGIPILARDGGYVRHHFTDGENGRLLFTAEEIATEVVALAREPARMSRFFARAQSMRLDDGDTWPSASRKFLTGLGQATRR
jgi:glycosyltransferase involved in cell wall biosynthesis